MEIQIISGKLGCYLKVNGLWIHRSFKNQFKAIRSKYSDAPYGASEFISALEIDKIWKEYRYKITEALKTPYKSEWGELIIIDPHSSEEQTRAIIKELIDAVTEHRSFDYRIDEYQLHMSGIRVDQALVKANSLIN